MLGKLLKHEIRQSARFVSVIYAIVGVTTAFTLLAMLIKSTKLTVIASALLVFVGIALLIMTMVAIIKNFYDSLYGSQGYLSFTLPVKCSKILLSKIITSYFWVFVSGIMFAVIVFLIYYNAMEQSQGALETLVDMLNTSGLAGEGIVTEIILKNLVYQAVNLLVDIFIFLGFVYFAITLANTRLLGKHPKFFGITIFFVLYGLATTVSSLLNAYVPLSMEISSENVGIVFQAAGVSFSSLSGLAGPIFMVIVSAVLLWLTGWIMEHKVNIR